MEIWRIIEGFPSYSVSNLGRVRRDIRGYRQPPPRILKNSRDHNGYAVVNLTHGAVRAKHYVHRLVASAFIGPQPSPAHHVAHWDGDGMNAAAGNLRWTVQSENESDKVRHGRNNHAPKGSRRFTSADIARMRQMQGDGHSLRAIGRAFQAPHMTIKRALENGALLQAS